MKKPTPHTRIALDYHECRDYLQQKYNYNENDYANKFGKSKVEGAPYQNFWHWLIYLVEAHNGSYFVMYKDFLDELDDEDDYRRIILNHYFNEFGNGEDAIEFWVSW